MVTVQVASGHIFANYFHPAGKDEILTKGGSSQHADVCQSTLVFIGILMWNSLRSWLSQEESQGKCFPCWHLSYLK